MRGPAWIRQVTALVILLAIWEAFGRAGYLNPLYAPSPSQIGGALYELFSTGRIWTHLDATRGKKRTTVAVAVARELACFVWEIANQPDT